MEKTSYRIVQTLIIISFFLTINSCAGSRYLKTSQAKGIEIKGTYTLILYGWRYGDDIENVAILDKEGDKYNFEVYAPEFDYAIKRGIQAKLALEEAEKFVGRHHAFWHSQLSSILDYEGNIIGYEIRPLYRPLDFGFPDVLDINYIIQDSRVVVNITLKMEIRKKLFNEDRPFLFRRD